MLHSCYWMNLVAVLASLPVGVIKHSDQSNLKEKGFILAHGSRPSSSQWGTQGSGSLKQLLILYEWSEGREKWNGPMYKEEEQRHQLMD